ncbi:hypothetical protein GYMLUDRAFT_239256 [Collybiopsis luxurians FD-317 M1]|nr:hypothetical protein GYMLUDRAFT_239256 [Collybiopsis luxurians FD-317 M1]
MIIKRLLARLDFFASFLLTFSFTTGPPAVAPIVKLPSLNSGTIFAKKKTPRACGSFSSAKSYGTTESSAVSDVPIYHKKQIPVISQGSMILTSSIMISPTTSWNKTLGGQHSLVIFATMRPRLVRKPMPSQVPTDGVLASFQVGRNKRPVQKRTLFTISRTSDQGTYR